MSHARVGVGAGFNAATAYEPWRTSRRRSHSVVRRWLQPGIGIKRWLVVVFAGLLLLAVAFALVACGLLVG